VLAPLLYSSRLFSVFLLSVSSLLLPSYHLVSLILRSSSLLLIFSFPSAVFFFGILFFNIVFYLSKSIYVSKLAHAHCAVFAITSSLSLLNFCNRASATVSLMCPSAMIAFRRIALKLIQFAVI
jgi:hypothetical protein